MNEKVKQALENVKNIKVGSMVLNDLFGEDLKVIETALNDYEEEKKELIAEQHRLFNLAKKQETELKELREFAKIVSKDIVISHNTTMSDDITYGCNFYDEILHKDEFNLIKKVVSKYGR